MDRPFIRVLAALLALSLAACGAGPAPVLTACQEDARGAHPGEQEALLRRQYATACMVANGFELRTLREGTECPAMNPAYGDSGCYRKLNVFDRAWRAIF